MDKKYGDLMNFIPHGLKMKVLGESEFLHLNVRQ